MGKEPNFIFFPLLYAHSKGDGALFCTFLFTPHLTFPAIPRTLRSSATRDPSTHLDGGSVTKRSKIHTHTYLLYFLFLSFINIVIIFLYISFHFSLSAGPHSHTLTHPHSLTHHSAHYPLSLSLTHTYTHFTPSNYHVYIITHLFTHFLLTC